MIIWWGTFICMAGAGTIVFHYGIQKAKRKSLRSMKSFEKPGEEWNPKKMKKYVKHAYFVIQEWQGNLSPETKIAIYDTFASKQAKWILTDNETNIIQDVLKNNYVQVDVAENYCLYTLKE